jgi:hypothetical protein
VEQPADVLPRSFSLEQNHPNPFNMATTIGFGVKEPCRVVLELYDLLGHKVATLVDNRYQPGFYRLNFKGTGLPTGVYFYRIEMGDFTAVKKLILLL